jgi:hypothetical protein
MLFPKKEAVKRSQLQAYFIALADVVLNLFLLSGKCPDFRLSDFQDRSDWIVRFSGLFMNLSSLQK